jgi:hypothetical protein
VDNRLKICFSIVCFWLFLLPGYAQVSEYGFWVGATNYFGDLNPNYSFKQSRGGAGLIYRHNFNNRFSARVGVHYAHIAASDAKLTTDQQPYRASRNLDFQSNIFELAGLYEFNFFNWARGSDNPRDNRKKWTPYAFVGLSLFNFSSYTFYDGVRYNLEPVGTEGQKNPNNTGPNGNQGYSQFAVAIPFGGGLKFALSPQWVMQFEVFTRRTFTDYIDDVSGNYPDPSELGYFVEGRDISDALYDRSPELGIPPIGFPGKQRGTSKDKDRFNYYSIGFTYTFMKKKCPEF